MRPFGCRSLLLACAGLFALSGAAEAGTVRVTVAEYSQLDFPHFRLSESLNKAPRRYPHAQ